MSPCQCQVLHLLVQRAGEVLSKDAVIHAGWHDVTVGVRHHRHAWAPALAVLHLRAR